MEQVIHHTSVMPNEVIELLRPSANEKFLDCTIGGGGHAKKILEQTGPKGILYGVDRDSYALERTTQTLKIFQDRIQLFHAEFGEISKVLPMEVWPTLNGVLIDCGVSSFQLDSPMRGFSFRWDSPLDMRMNASQSMSAKTFLTHTNEKDLADVIYQLGEERNSRKIAKNIVVARKKGKLNTTFDLVNAVLQSFPHRNHWKIHPATKTFQAIRMYINQELDEIRVGITAILSLLPMGSKIVVITFHSLEDRLVKNIFRNAVKEKKAKLLVKKPLVPTRSETKENPRSRSAKVRGIEIVL